MVNATNNIADFRPMLSASLPCMGEDRVPTQDEVIADLKRLNWKEGFLVSPKIDGIRAINHPQLGLVSRTLKTIPNRFIQTCIASHGAKMHYMDGELVKGNLVAGEIHTYNDNQSAIMSSGGRPTFTYCIFDNIEYDITEYLHRLSIIEDRFDRTEVILDIEVSDGGIGTNFTVMRLKQRFIQSIGELLDYEEEQIAAGYEGIILRHPRLRYKNGRSTFREQGMIKLKRFVDGEAQIKGFVELKRNINEATIDALGYQKRSAHLAGKVAAGTLGALEVVGVGGAFDGVEFEIGSGLDEATRAEIWANQSRYTGSLVKYKFQPHGVKDKPRAPIFLGFRSREDL